jgi:nitrate reductase / nitrite oxidoreductase, beta subunit
MVALRGFSGLKMLTASAMRGRDASGARRQQQASLLSGGNEEIIRDVYKKLVAVRVYMRSKKVKDIPQEEVQRALAEGKTTAEEVEAI